MVGDQIIIQFAWGFVIDLQKMEWNIFDPISYSIWLSSWNNGLTYKDKIRMLD